MRTPSVSGSTLSVSQASILWRLAQFKYGWTYISTVGQRSAVRALARRGLVTYDREYRVTVTAAGEREVSERWPNSPLALHTYETPAGGWDKP